MGERSWSRWRWGCRAAPGRVWRVRTWRSGAACHRVALVSHCGLLLYLVSEGYWANRAAQLRWWPDPTRSKPSAIPAEQDDKTTSDTAQIAIPRGQRPATWRAQQRADKPIRCLRMPNIKRMGTAKPLSPVWLVSPTGLCRVPGRGRQPARPVGRPVDACSSTQIIFMLGSFRGPIVASEGAHQSAKDL